MGNQKRGKSITSPKSSTDCYDIWNFTMYLCRAVRLVPARIRDTRRGGTSEQVERCPQDRESKHARLDGLFCGSGNRHRCDRRRCRRRSRDCGHDKSQISQARD
jgi:hypothetical protein